VVWCVCVCVVCVCGVCVCGVRVISVVSMADMLAKMANILLYQELCT